MFLLIISIILIIIICIYCLNNNIVEGYDLLQNCIGVYEPQYRPCSKTCGGGEQERKFYVTEDPVSGYFRGNWQDAVQCPPDLTRECNTHNCPIDCKYVRGGDGWGDWDKNLDSNGKQIGTETRTRQIRIKDEYGGKSCDNLTETRKHNVNCVQSKWSDWGACSKTCGGGTKTKTRSILQEKKNGGQSCGPSSDKTSCNTQGCPVDCVLGSWSNKGGCSKTCGSGVMQQTNAIITNPAHGGTKCGPRWRNVSCNTKPCVLESGNYRIKTTYHAAGNQPGGWGLSAWHAHGARRNGSSSRVAVHNGNYWPMKWNIVPGEKQKTWRILTTYHAAGNQQGGWGLSAWHDGDTRRNGSSSWVAVHNGKYWPMDWVFEKA